MSDNDLARTPLYDLHLELGAKMVPFAGYAMPVQYPLGIMKEHNHTRAAAGLFDVSHMGQARLYGASVAENLERLAPMDISGLKQGRQRYALFTSPQGGILDDLMICNAGDHYFVVVNAACKQQDFEHLQANLGAGCKFQELSGRALLALQGPKAAEVLARFSAQVDDLTFMSAQLIKIADIDCFITRSGYTGEDGFEISLPAEHAEAFARKLLAEDEVAAIGLGARDSLRLEAGLCLYGHDIDTTTTPVEANLTWAIQKVRRSGGARAGGFPGADIILEQITAGVERCRVGLQPQGRAPVREGAQIINAEGQTVGKVSSGGFGPSVGAPIAMAYVETAASQVGTQLQALVRGKALPATIVTMPFVTQRYYRGNKQVNKV